MKKQSEMDVISVFWYNERISMNVNEVKAHSCIKKRAQ